MVEEEKSSFLCNNPKERFKPNKMKETGRGNYFLLLMLFLKLISSKSSYFHLLRAGILSIHYSKWSRRGIL